MVNRKVPETSTQAPLSVPYLIQNDLGQMHKSSFDVNVRLCAGLHEGDRVLATDRLASLLRYDALIGHVTLIAEQHLLDVFVCMLVIVLQCKVVDTG